MRSPCFDAVFNTMTNADLLDEGMHVRLTRRAMDVEFQWDRLLELTRGLVPAGGPALQLILPAVAETVRPHWYLLGGTGLSPLAIGGVGERLARTLAELDPWSKEGIEASFAAVGAAFDSTGDRVRALASVFVLGDLTRLPAAEVFEVMGRERCVKRLHDSTQAYQSMQMIG